MTVMLNTKMRRNLLAYAFTHADETYYLRELASLIYADPGNLSRELKKLEREGLYKSVVKGSMKFYSLNKNYPLYHELKSISYKTSGVEGSLREMMKKFHGITRALIYGSYAAGSEKKSSDIDVIVVGKYPEGQFTKEINKLESRLGREINFTAYTEEEYRKEAVKKGGFLNIVTKGKTIFLKGGGLNVR